MLSAAMAVSCAVEPIPDLTETSGQGQTLTIQAVLDDSSDAAETKTVRNDDGSVSWQTGDRISLFFGSGSNGGSAFTTTDSGKTASFTGTIEAFTAGGEDFDGGMVYFWGLYPYDAAATCNNTSVTTNIPSTQRGVAGTFSSGQHMTLARSENLLMSFKSVCSGLRFSLQTEGVESAVFHPIGNEAVVGDITVSMTDGLPVVTSMRNTSSEITLIPDGGAFEVGKDYYFEFAPFTATRGFDVTLYKGNQQATFTFSTSRTFARNKYTWKTNLDEGLEWSTIPGYDGKVDLGLSVLWATCNLGASAPEESGDYYAWGETSPKDVCNWENYKWSNNPSNGHGHITKYNPPMRSTGRPYYDYDDSYMDHKIILDADDDAASTQLQELWRTPTIDEWDELLENCTWTWTKRNNVWGYNVSSNVSGYEGNSIFLPAAGYCDERGYDSCSGLEGIYMSSSLAYSYPNTTDMPYNFYRFDLCEDICWTPTLFRCCGTTIRPVYGERVIVPERLSLDKTEVSLYVNEGTSISASFYPASVSNKYESLTWNTNPSSSILRFESNNWNGKTAQIQSNAPVSTKLTVHSINGLTAECAVSIVEPKPYIDENGIDRGKGIEIVETVNGVSKTVVWAPVNLGYSEKYPYGKLYQWGRKAGQGYGPANGNDEAGNKTTVTTSTATSGYPLVNPEAGTFYKYVNYYTYDWYAATTGEQFKVNWNEIEETEYVGNPCPKGWRVPTRYELEGLIVYKSSWTTKNGQNGYYFKGSLASLPDASSLFLPASGYRDNNDGRISNRGGNGRYWSSTPYSLSASSLYFSSSSASVGSFGRAYGNSVRCVQE